VFLNRTAVRVPGASNRRVVPKELKAIIFDVDGTLYDQHVLRGGILRRLCREYACKPLQGLKTARILSAYRTAQEHLRKAGAEGDIAEKQLQLACEWTGHPRELVRSCVDRWMGQEPLRLLAGSVRSGCMEFLQTASGRKILLAVLSDYEAQGKLSAMGLEGCFQSVVSAQDPDVQQFKPGTRGLEVTLERLRVEVSEALYIGDRPEVDGTMASRAGMPCLIIGTSRKSKDDSWIGVRNYHQLKRTLFC
jgi:FMN phosphatase YigB (HAD superfamily)